MEEKRDSITSDAMEALIGAIYLDGGFTNAKEFIHHFILTDLEDKKLFYDSKTILQEIVQANMTGNVSYELIDEQGPDHNKIFEVEARIGEKPGDVEKEARRSQQNSRQLMRQF